MTTAKQKLAQTREQNPKPPKPEARKTVTAKQKLNLTKSQQSKGYDVLDEYL